MMSPDSARGASVESRATAGGKMKPLQSTTPEKPQAISSTSYRAGRRPPHDARLL